MPLTKSELYLGASISGVFAVDRDRFDAFLVADVTPRFLGFTVIVGNGYWKGKAEFVRILTIIHDPSEPTADSGRLVTEIAESYKARFAQESVLRVDSIVEASF